jgi:transglutaminase-like putative cysteine protease
MSSAMAFGREKRLLLGWLALLAPLPLPFNEVLEWPVLFLYLLALIHFLGKAEDPGHKWLDNRALNGLGLLYLPLLGFDAWQGAQRGQAVTPLLHLTLFVLVVKLYSVRQEKEKWHVLLAVFFLFVAAMATSSNFAVVVYLLGALAFFLLALSRLAELHMVSALGPSAGGTAGGEAARAAPAVVAGLPRPRRGSWLAILAVAILTAPIFAALPRLSQPFLTGRGAGNLGLSRVSGFSDEVSLGFSGTIRTSQQIAMRLRFSRPVARPEELRFKGAAYDFYRERKWHRDDDLYQDLRSQDGSFTLAEPAAATASVQISLEPLQSRSLLVPSEAVSLDFGGGPSRLYADGGGGLILPFGGQRQQALDYTVALGAAPNIRATLENPGGGTSALDASAVTPRMRELARRVMGEGGAEQKIRRLEAHLLTEYGYTVDISDEGGDPIEDFLFVKKVGHCEYFATAMVLLLRAEGIPARFVTGFLGAEPNGLEDLHVVRQSNAHAWVEAYAEPGGWRVYDPTPPSGRPGIAAGGLGLWARQLYEFIAFRWDRYVLTYGAEDQGDLRERLQAFFAGIADKLKSWLGRGEEAVPEAGPPSAGAESAAVGEEASTAPAASSGGLGALSAGLVAALLLGAGLLLWRRRPQTATAAYLELRRRLEAAELGVSPATPPLELAGRLRRLLPGQDAAIDRLIALYLNEAFAGRPLGAAEKRELAPLRSGLRRDLQKALRRLRAEAAAERRSAGIRLAEKVAKQL